MYLKTLVFFLLLTFTLKSQIKIDDVGDGWKSQVESAISLIQTTDDLRYSLLIKNCNHIEFGVNGNSTTHDSTIVIDKSVFDRLSYPGQVFVATNVTSKLIFSFSHALIIFYNRS